MSFEEELTDSNIDHSANLGETLAALEELQVSLNAKIKLLKKETMATLSTGKNVDGYRLSHRNKYTTDAKRFLAYVKECGYGPTSFIKSSEVQLLPYTKIAELLPDANIAELMEEGIIVREQTETVTKCG